MLSIAEQAIMKGVTAVCRMRNSFSAAGGARLCSPLQGSLSDGSLPKASPARGGGCAARRSRRGALPPCGGGVLRSRAGPCLVFRRGRCSHCPGSPAPPQGSAAGEIARPTWWPGAGGDTQVSAPSRARRRADEIIGPCAGGSTPQPSSACHACRPRSRRPFALHCRAGVHARREGLRRRLPFLQKILKKTGAGCKIPAGPFVV